MPKNPELSPAAREDYKKIIHYIAQDNPIAALQVRDAFEEAFLKLAENPNMGHRRDDLTSKPVRFWGLYSYQIVYDSDSSPLVILRILSGYRDIEDILESGS